MDSYDFDSMMHMMMGGMFNSIFSQFFRGGRVRGGKHKMKMPGNIFVRQVNVPS